jgi:microcystin-dependent protein
MLGNGSSGLKVVAGQGTSGQSLTSNGTGSAPTWQSPVAVPPGSITAYATTTAPTGWLLCNGATVASTTYADLFAIIGWSYGGTPGGDFVLPDLRGRNVLMASTTANMGQTGGESTHTQTWSELAAHSHADLQTFANGANGDGSASVHVQAGGRTEVVGTSTPFNVLDPYLALNYIIKF